MFGFTEDESFSVRGDSFVWLNNKKKKNPVSVLTKWEHIDQDPIVGHCTPAAHCSSF